ncbi:hypothetical protein JL722_13439 [Aureococcus anophagefferens]|nr:hypothetical protein JL722_13439 [Aureococcus anophagefferens]
MFEIWGGKTTRNRHCRAWPPRWSRRRVRIVVADAEAPDGFERERESLRRACRDAPPPPQCRSGDTAGGVWVARDASRPSCGAYTGRPEGRFAGLAAVDVDRDPKLWAQEERKRDALRAANGPTGDRWRYALPGCAYRYFDGGELERALAAEAPLVLFVGDSTARLLYVAFAEWLGAAITDTELYLDPSGDGAQFVSGAARVAYLQMWSEDQYRSLVLGPLRRTWAAAARDSRGPTAVVANFAAVHSLDGTCDGLRGARAARRRRRPRRAPGALRFVFQSAPCGLGRRQGNFRTGKSLEVLRAPPRRRGPPPPNATWDVLDLANVTMARYDATFDGTHFYGSAIAAQALAVANMLARRPADAS